MTDFPVEVENAKNALVAKLTELTKASNDASNAALDFYRVLQAHGTVDAADIEGLTGAIADTVRQAASIVVPLVPEAVEEEPVKKRKRAKKDPNAPKKPLTLFFMFRDEVRPQLIQERQTKGEEPLLNVELLQLLLKLWAELLDAEKARYKERYSKLWADYQKEMVKYNEGKEGAEAADTTSEVTIEPKVEEPADEGDDKKKKKAKTEGKKEKKDKKKKKEKK